MKCTLPVNSLTIENKIFTGVDVFEKMKHYLGITYDCAEVELGHVTFVLCRIAEPNTMFTEDPLLVKALKELDKKFNKASN